MSLPNIYQRHQERQLDQAVDIMKQALLAAQNTALTNQSVILKPLNKGDWSTGLVLVNNKMARSPKVIYQWQWPTNKIEVTWQGFNQLNYLLFTQAVYRNALNGYFSIYLGHRHCRMSLNRLGIVSSIINNNS